MEKKSWYTSGLDSSGSALVSAVAFSIILAIGGIGYLLISTNSINNETTAFQDLRCLNAGESGVNFGLYLLKACNTWPAAGNTSTYPGSGYFTINNLSVQAVISATSATVVNITANVYSSDGSVLLKKVGYNSVSPTFAGDFATLYNSFWMNNPEYRDCGGIGSPYRGFSGGTNFYGRVHSNCFIEIHNLSTGKFWPAGSIPSKVTVANNSNPNLNHSYSGYGIGRNNYQTGIMVDPWCGGTGCGPSTDKASVTPAQLDAVFTGTYLANQDTVSFPANQSYATWTTIAGLSYNVTPSFDVPNDVLPLKNTFNNYHPTLKFIHSGGSYGTGSIKYYYHNSSHNPDSATILYSNYNHKVICVPTSVNVYGKVDGAVTIATPLNTNIYIVDTLAYWDANLSNHTMPPLGTVPDTNMLGLVPGQNIVFDASWKQPDGITIKQIQFNDGMLNVTASILAVENLNDAAGRQGTEYWVSNADGGIPAIAYNEQYRLQLFGNHVLAAPREFRCSDGTGSFDWGNHSYYYDTRLSATQPPGLNNGLRAGGMFVLNARGWFEQTFF